ncbi:rhodanese-like domain-containing protein [Candidatus Profftia lariciata]|uniref:rhodanese-like domain-containing protein n=1 Tax=Candidatus Profftia lariciata TaxID=1987921 RepID=UPI003B967C1B
MHNILQFLNTHIILSLTWIMLFLTLLIITYKVYFSKIKEITRNKAMLLINKEHAIIVDIRPCEDFRDGHLANSINIHPLNLRKGNINQLKYYKNKPVIVVCAYGTNSRASGNNLVKAGFQYVYILKDGIIGWVHASLPLVRGK